MDRASPRVISLIAFPRSGTTFLGRRLARGAGVQYLEEPIGTWYRAFLHGPSDRSLGIRKGETADKWFRRNWNKTAPTIVEKTPSNILRVRDLADFFPDITFLVLLRNPLDVSQSVFNKWCRGIDRNHQYLRESDTAIGTPTRILATRLRKARQIGRLDAIWEQRRRIFDTLAASVRRRPAPFERVLRVPGLEELGGEIDVLNQILWAWINAHLIFRLDARSLSRDRLVFLDYDGLTNGNTEEWRKIETVIGTSIDSSISRKESSDSPDTMEAAFDPYLRNHALYLYKEMIYGI